MLKKLLQKAVLMLICCLFTFTSASAADIGETQITSAGACVMDYETGRVLYDYNGESTLIPASMTKIMTMYCIYDAIDSGEISYDTVVPISPNVSGLGAKDPGLTVIPLHADTAYTVDELIDMVVVVSANDAALALAELIAGSEQAFVERMNNTASELGINAHFYDCYGLANNEITPISMAELSRRIINDHPDILNRSSKTLVSFHGGNYKTTNHLLDSFYYSGADGLKTGTTTSAGCCFCGTAVRDNVRMIAVTMGSANNDQRFIDAARLLDYGFSAKKELFSKLYFTNIRTIIDDKQIPTLYHMGDKSPVIIAEDLEHYGFDIEYKSDTLTLTRRRDKKYSPIAPSYYRNKDGEPAYDIIEGKTTRVILYDGAVKHEFDTVYSLNGYTGITTDEFGKIYEKEWIDSTSTLLINTDNKADCLLQVCTPSFETIDFSSTPPMTCSGTTMIPVRTAAEAMGAIVCWDNNLQAYTIDFNNVTTAIVPDSTSFTKITDAAVTHAQLPDVPHVINGNLCVSPHDLACIMGLSVVVDEGSRTILFKNNINSPFLCTKTAAEFFSAPLPDISIL